MAAHHARRGRRPRRRRLALKRQWRPPWHDWQEFRGQTRIPIRRPVASAWHEPTRAPIGYRLGIPSMPMIARACLPMTMRVGVRCFVCRVRRARFSLRYPDPLWHSAPTRRPVLPMTGRSILHAGDQLSMINGKGKPGPRPYGNAEKIQISSATAIDRRGRAIRLCGRLRRASTVTSMTPKSIPVVRDICTAHAWRLSDSAFPPHRWCQHPR